VGVVLKDRLLIMRSKIPFYNREEFEDRFVEVEKILDKKSNEYFFKYMKIILSFGRPVRMSEYGYEEGLKLYEKWKKGEELSREEIILIGFMMSDICVLEESPKMMEDLNQMYNQMVTKYKPDFQYLQNFGQKHLLEGGYVESNPYYMHTVEQMFTTDYILPSSEQIRMITTGEMPIYEDVRVCPYCGKQFERDSVEDLFKHVKAEHSKK